MKEFFKQPLSLLTTAIGLGLVLPSLMMDGMFMDAAQYTAVSHNMANGIGGLWTPYFTMHNVADLPYFYEQPPLVFGLQALFFYVFGSSLYVERIFILLSYLVSAILIVKIWNTTFPQLKRIAWLPLLLWCIMPVVFWSFSNNMLENTMGVFVLLSAFHAIKAMEQPNYLLNALIAGFWVMAATLSKGIPGLFPLAIPMLYSILHKEIKLKKAVLINSLMIAIPIVFYAGFLLYDPAREFFQVHLFGRAFKRIGQAPTVDNPFHILWEALQQFAVPLMLIFLIWVVSRKKVNSLPALDKPTIFFLLLGLCGILPLCLTLVQRGFYLIPALPFIAIGLAALIRKHVIRFQNLKNSLIKKVSLVLLTGVMIITIIMAGKPKRDAQLLQDVKRIARATGANKTLAFYPYLFWEDWSLKAYLMRYHFIQGSYEFGSNYNWYLTDKGHPLPDPRFEELNIGLNNYKLYKRKDERD